MNAAELLDKLQYRHSPNFFSADDGRNFDDAADFAHIFRRAQDKLELRGVYTLRQPVDDARDTIVPVVYVCEVDDDSQARQLHKQVWNQNVVPFVIVVSPTAVRLYSGFRFEKDSDSGSDESKGILRVAKDINSALDALDAFQSDKIDDGTIWEQWGKDVTPETRVDWKLLSSLNDLDQWLRENGLEDQDVSHSLIGKYVYLRYLRDRDILSDRRLDEWGLTEQEVFSRKATLKAFWSVVEELDDWLNGSVFPLSPTGENRPRQEHLRKVAGTFSGDDPSSGQLSLDFDMYDFSYIPIETLSVIYEQFLHAPTDDNQPTKGKTQGAYYTPIPLVNFMLEEMDALHPFENGMRVLDPACGSGAFLVQCYRRIVEQDEEFEPGKAMRPKRLRELLEQHVFGIDRDPDACRVAELSLSLTLLDYVDPPDLMRYSNFQLPSLHNQNIFHGDFFDSESQWRTHLANVKFDWIVGNPPWVELKSGKVSEQDKFAWQWFQDRDNQKNFPTGGNQVTEAFVWEVTKFVQDDGQVALLIPAMTWFKDESKKFRAKVLESFSVNTVANFSNFAEVLFPGHRYKDGARKAVKRPRRPAIAIFYTASPNLNESVSVFSPFVAKQSPNAPIGTRRRKDTWSIVVDESQISDVLVTKVLDGDALPWKIAMWGSHHDARLLATISRKYAKQTLETFSTREGLSIAEGFQLRTESAGEDTEPLPEVVGKSALNMNLLKNCGLIFEFPKKTLEPIPAEKGFVRKGRGKLPLSVSKPPHIIVDVSRRFAVFSNKFIAVPARQIGIAGTKVQSDILKSISLWIVSDFAKYHQFFHSPQWGISNSISTLETLRSLPMPFGEFTDDDFADWAELHSRFCKAPVQVEESTLFDDASSDPTVEDLLIELNQRVAKLLKLKKHDRALIADLVNTKFELLQGKVGESAIEDASPASLLNYAMMLRDELDAFVDDQPKLKHEIVVSTNGRSAMVAVKLLQNEARVRKPKINQVDDETAKEFQKIQKRVRKKHSQWFYFDRNLRIYEGNTTYILKPLSRLNWTQSQAMQDASTIIAETLS